LLETVGACLELLSSAPLTLFRGWKASNSSWMSPLLWKSLSWWARVFGQSEMMKSSGMSPLIA
jgi:hypothetical protein